LSDCIYWYGLVVKNNKNLFNYDKIIDKPITDIDFNKYIEQRKIKFVDSDNILRSLEKPLI